MLVALDTFHPSGGGVVDSVRDLSAVGALDAGLRLPATVPAETAELGEDLDLLVELVDFFEATWTPTVTGAADGTIDGTTGIVLAPKAAADLGVDVGDTVALRHPVRLDDGRFALTLSEVEVAGVHVNPMRVFAFMDLDEAERFGLSGTTNFLHAYPTEGVSRAELQAAVFGLLGVASSQSVARIGESFDEALNQFVGILFIAAGAVLVLALLIAFNATRITVEERRREHATMRAFGLPVRSVLGIVVRESVIVGLLATAIGVVAGGAFLGWMLQSLATTTLPDLQIDRYVSPTTLIVAAIVGIIAVAAAPLFLIGRLRRMNIPDTLRVME